jgi:hypothetical protein
MDDTLVDVLVATVSILTSLALGYMLGWKGRGDHERKRYDLHTPRLVQVAV